MYIIMRTCIIALIICTQIQSKELFEAHRAGLWYPAEPKALTELLNQLSDTAQNAFAMKTDGTQIRALIAPHAGYVYSGIVAAAVYNLVAQKNIDRIIILGPSHFTPLHGIAIPSFTHYHTPLGTLVVDINALKTLKNDALTSLDNTYFTPEHSIEMQLPFIQNDIAGARIIPIIVGSLSKNDVTHIAQLLKPLITRKTLVVISSDFTHYGSNFQYIPFNKNILLNINQLDSAVLDPIQHHRCNAFETVINQTHDTVCGFNPIRILLELINQEAFGAVTTRLVAHGTSYEVTHDAANVVSYAGLIVTNEMDNDVLNKQEQNSLLTYARETLEQAFKPTVNPDLLKPIMTLLLEKPQGAFPTLWTMYKNGKKDLRGCIGQIYPDKPLYQIVAEKVLDSAFHDSRFIPLQQAELPQIEIQISVLKKPKSISSYKDIVLHKHGIILTNGDHSALFLPTVPAEFGFDLTKTLQELSLKAGLDKNAWKLPSTTFQVFEAQDFEE